MLKSWYQILGLQNMTSGNQQANLAAQMQFGPLLYSYQLAMAQAQQAQQQQQAPPPPKPAPKAKCEFYRNLNLNRSKIITLVLISLNSKATNVQQRCHGHAESSRNAATVHWNVDAGQSTLEPARWTQQLPKQLNDSLMIWVLFFHLLRYFISNHKRKHLNFERVKT